MKRFNIKFRHNSDIVDNNNYKVTTIMASNISEAIKRFKENNSNTYIIDCKMADYPEGAKYDKNAPYNKIDNPEKEIDVLVSITLSKNLKVKVTDYDVKAYKDEDGELVYDYDFSNCNLTREVNTQKYLPQTAFILVKSLYNLLSIADKNNKYNVYQDRIDELMSDLEGWNVDDMVCIKEID